MMPGDDSLVFKSRVDPEGRGKLVLTEQTWHGSSASANMCRNKVLFSQSGFFFFSCDWRKHSNVWETKYSVWFFSSPKIQLKQKGYLCVYWLRGKRMKQVHLGREPAVSLSHSSVLEWLWNGEWGNGYWVMGPETPLVFCLFTLSHFPPVCVQDDRSVRCLTRGGFCPGCRFLHCAAMKNDNNLNSWPWCDYCSYMFCFPQKQNRWLCIFLNVRLTLWH